MRSFAALSVVLLVTCTSASVTVVLKRGQNDKFSAVANIDRANSLKSPAGWPVTVSATNWALGFYTTSVAIGNPPTYYNLLIDTGSSNTWCGAGKPYNRTSTSIPTGQPLNITYGSGNLTGLEYLDQVTVAPGLVITNQSIGDVITSAGIQGVDGFIGLGPVDLTNHTDNNTMIPTVMNNLASQGLIKNQVLGVYFAPYSGNESVTNGALTYGGTDPSLYQGEVTYVPVTNTLRDSLYWGINVTSATYGNYTIIPESTAVIVDSGTTQVLLADNLFQSYMGAIPGATFNSTIATLQIPNNSIPSMQPLSFKMADKLFTLDVAAQLVPQDQNAVLGGDPGQQYGVVGSLKPYGLNALNAILGMAFMERYYVVFDADNKQVGFAQTNNTFSSSLFYPDP